MTRVLIADDEPQNLLLLEASLESLGCETMRAEGGRAALALFESSAPDLIILDIVMPEIDGLEVLARVRAHETRGDTPVVLVTAHSEGEYRLRGFEAGADEFLEKPIDTSVLLARVRTLLRLKESRDALAARSEVLERLQREQRELTQFIVHDLKNPIASLLTNLQWSLEQMTGDLAGSELQEALTDGHEAAMRLKGMIGDLLIVSRLEESSYLLSPEAVPIAELVRGVTGAYSRMAHERRVELCANADIDGEVGEVTADRELLRRVLENVLESSLRHTPPSGHVRVAARRGDGIEIAVSNDGPSIPMQERERIFDKFPRARHEGRTAGNASLGLYFCRRAIEAQGGKIGIEESAEWPTSFVIRLPNVRKTG